MFFWLPFKKNTQTSTAYWGGVGRPKGYRWDEEVSEKRTILGCGFKDFWFSPLLGEDSQFDEHIFQMGWFNHQLDNVCQNMCHQLVTWTPQPPQHAQEKWKVNCPSYFNLPVFVGKPQGFFCYMFNSPQATGASWTWVFVFCWVAKFTKTLPNATWVGNIDTAISLKCGHCSPNGGK